MFETRMQSMAVLFFFHVAHGNSQCHEKAEAAEAQSAPVVDRMDRMDCVDWGLRTTSSLQCPERFGPQMTMVGTICSRWPGDLSEWNCKDNGITVQCCAENLKLHWGYICLGAHCCMWHPHETFFLDARYGKENWASRPSWWDSPGKFLQISAHSLVAWSG